MENSKLAGLAALGLAAASAAVLAFPTLAAAAESVPSVTINTSSTGDLSHAEVFTGLKLSILMSTLVFLPSLFMAATSFTRIAIVLALTRQALGTAQTPPNQVMLGLALFLTFGVMGPTFQKIYDDAIVPYSEDQISHKEAFDKAFTPLRSFMLDHTRESDLALFIEITKQEMPESPESLGPTVVIPAFIISELNSAFQIAFLIFLPFRFQSS